MSEIVLMGDPRVTGVPVVESGEPLVDVATAAGVLVDGRYATPAGNWRLVRSSVRDRLAVAAAALPDELRLLLVEGHRLPSQQLASFTEYRDELAAADPGLSDADLDRLASRYIAPPGVAPHTAGAAVDLTLCTAAGGELDMGTRVNATPEESRLACYTAAPDLDDGARANRDLLCRVLAGAGLVNYPTEWWHWSYGDRYWAMQTGAPAALHGPVGR